MTGTAEILACTLLLRLPLNLPRRIHFIMNRICGDLYLYILRRGIAPLILSLSLSRIVPNDSQVQTAKDCHTMISDTLLFNSLRRF
jgi:hypothetical protein